MCPFDDAEESLLMTDFPEETHSSATPQCRNTLSLITAVLCVDANDNLWEELGDMNTISGSSVRSQTSSYSRSSAISVTAVHTRGGARSSSCLGGGGRGRGGGGVLGLPMGLCLAGTSPLPESDSPPIMPLRAAARLYSNSNSSVGMGFDFGTFAPLTVRVLGLAALSAPHGALTHSGSHPDQLQGLALSHSDALTHAHARTVSSLTSASTRTRTGGLGGSLLGSELSCVSADEEEEAVVAAATLASGSSMSVMSVMSGSSASDTEDHTTIQSSWSSRRLSLSSSSGDDDCSTHSLTPQSQQVGTAGGSSGGGERGKGGSRHQKQLSEKERQERKYAAGRKKRRPAARDRSTAE